MPDFPAGSTAECRMILRLERSNPHECKRQSIRDKGELHMPEPWSAEHQVSPELALQLIRSQFPQLPSHRIESLGAGWDNTAYLLGADVVFRFPRRLIAVELLETESRVLPLLSAQLPLPVPVPRWRGAPSQDFPWTFHGYRMLPGRRADCVELTHQHRCSIAAELGEFLRALHSIPPNQLPLPPDTIGRTDLRPKVAVMRERADALEKTGLFDASLVHHLLEQPLPARSSRSVVVHGDLYERHLIVNEQHCISGVIDWGDVHVGDPAVDLSIVYRLLPAEERDAFYRVYGQIDARTAAMAQWRAAFHALQLAAYLHSTNDTAGLNVTRKSLQYIFQD
ncbi:MAG TPA: phosphotransferase [Planctomycetota bacterium]|nr:phosphotransferase [Planctomycetota bacterium]